MERDLDLQYLFGAWFLGVTVVLVNDDRVSDIVHLYVLENNPLCRPFSSLSVES